MSDVEISFNEEGGKLLDSICDLVNKRINEEFHINAETATYMIYEYIQKYTCNLLDSLPDLIFNKIYNEYGYSDYATSDCDWDELVRQALKEIKNEHYSSDK
jgi:hypothetical protein